MKELISKNLLKHLLIVIGVIALSQIGAHCFRGKANNDSIELLNSISENHDIQIEGIKLYSKLEKEETKKLEKLFKIVENYKNHHKSTFLLFYKNYFASTTTLLILSCISVVILFMIANVGLNNANAYFKTLFYVLAALTSFYAFSPLVYKQDINISENLKRYIKYDNLQGKIYNYSITTKANDTITFEKFHTDIINEISNINSINVEFDYKIIPKPDFNIESKR